MKLRDVFAILIGILFIVVSIVTGFWVFLAILGGFVLGAAGLLLVICGVIAYLSDLFERIDEGKDPL